MRKFLLILAGCAAGFLVVESGLRLTANERPVSSLPLEIVDLYEYDQTLGWKLRPFASSSQDNEDFNALYATNAQGFRAAQDYDPFPKKNERRILVFGDSFAFGIGVSEEKTFSQVLGENSSATVMNFGVSGYDPGQYLLSLREKASYKPSAVIFAVYLGNDLEDLPLNHLSQGTRQKPFFTLENQALVLQNTPVPRESVPSQDGDYRIKNALLRKVSTKIFQLKTVGLMKDTLKGNFYPILERMGAVKSVKDYGPQLAVLEGIFKEANTISSGRFIVLIIPSKNAPENYLEQELYQKVKTITEENKIPVADMMFGHDALWYFPHEGHFNEAGHKAAAERLKPLLP